MSRPFRGVVVVLSCNVSLDGGGRGPPNIVDLYALRVINGVVLCGAVSVEVSAMAPKPCPLNPHSLHQPAL